MSNKMKTMEENSWKQYILLSLAGLVLPIAIPFVQVKIFSCTVVL